MLEKAERGQAELARMVKIFMRPAGDNILRDRRASPEIG